ncbi:uncharacterized protein [Epargyreus clarus]|uniref:uncharacterized protein n=1 Tax=Epargyreus clarus TaxID=520877 RepID=UPI003C2CF1D7
MSDLLEEEIRLFWEYVKRLILTLAFAASISAAAEASPPYGLLDKLSTVKPDGSDPIDPHAIYKKQIGPQEHHPIYRLEEHKNEGRARIEPVKPVGPVVRHDMLADEPASTGENDRVDNSAASNYGYGNPVEVAYPDIPYAPGYGYGPDYGANSYDLYRNNPNDYLMEPDTSTVGLLWSQVPDSRQIVGYVGRTFIWIMNSMFVLFLGSMFTVGICSYTNLCSITFNGVGPIHEEMRSLITPERLEKISHAANFVKTAIDKYQKIQKVTDTVSTRRRRALFN